MNKLQIDDLLYQCITAGMDRTNDPGETRRYWELCDQIHDYNRDLYERLMRMSWQGYVGRGWGKSDDDT